MSGKWPIVGANELKKSHSPNIISAQIRRIAQMPVSLHEPIPLGFRLKIQVLCGPHIPFSGSRSISTSHFPLNTWHSLRRRAPPILKALQEVGGTQWLTLDQQAYPDGKTPMECTALSFEALKKAV